MPTQHDVYQPTFKKYKIAATTGKTSVGAATTNEKVGGEVVFEEEEQQEEEQAASKLKEEEAARKVAASAGAEEKSDSGVSIGDDKHACKSGNAESLNAKRTSGESSTSNGSLVTAAELPEEQMIVKKVKLNEVAAEVAVE